MGLLINTKTKQQVYLKSTHSMGRDPQITDTHLDDYQCSRLQCILRFQNNRWVLLDKSKNGTFLNGKRLHSTATELKNNDLITFPSGKKNAWKIIDIRAPKPVLVSNDNQKYIELDLLNLLPNEENPQLLLTHQMENDTWIVERGESARLIKGGDTLYFSDYTWTFHPNDQLLDTHTFTTENTVKNTMQLSFEVSLNEENVNLLTQFNNVTYEMGHKAHHPFLLALARRLIEDNANDIPPHEQGWIATELLLQDLGVEPNHLNILIFRARKAFEAINVTHSPIDRRNGEIRLCMCNISLIKGDYHEEYSPST